MSDKQLRRPLPGSKRRVVYDSLAYNTGQTVADIMIETHLKPGQVRSALQGMEEYGLVEKWKSAGVVVWARVGASESNDPTSPVRLLAAPADAEVPTSLSDVIETTPPYSAKHPWRG